MDKVFLGGTCAETNWRADLISSLNSFIRWFNPVVDDWTPDCIEIENKEKELCNIHLYYITSEMKGVYSIAEVIDSVHTKGKITILHINPEGFVESELRSLMAVVKMVKRNGGIAYVDNELYRTSRVINNITSEN